MAHACMTTNSVTVGVSCVGKILTTRFLETRIQPRSPKNHMCADVHVNYVVKRGPRKNYRNQILVCRPSENDSTPSRSAAVPNSTTRPENPHTRRCPCKSCGQKRLRGPNSGLCRRCMVIFPGAPCIKAHTPRTCAEKRCLSGVLRLIISRIRTGGFMASCGSMQGVVAQSHTPAAQNTLSGARRFEGVVHLIGTVHQP